MEMHGRVDLGHSPFGSCCWKRRKMQGRPGICTVAPLSKTGKPEQVGKCEVSHFGCANFATIAWHPNGDIKRVIGEKILAFKRDGPGWR